MNQELVKITLNAAQIELELTGIRDYSWQFARFSLTIGMK